MFGFMVNKDPAAMLRMLMAERGISVTQLAETSGISKATISALRFDPDRQPHDDTARLIARSLGVRTSTIWPNR